MHPLTKSLINLLIYAAGFSLSIYLPILPTYYLLPIFPAIYALLMGIAGGIFLRNRSALLALGQAFFGSLISLFGIMPTLARFGFGPAPSADAALVDPLIYALSLPFIILALLLGVVSGLVITWAKAR